LLTLVVLPALANNHPRSTRIICANNLRQLGAALQLWGNDHNDLFPPYIPTGDGGTRNHPLGVNAWLHFAWLSNDLSSAKVIFCPSDTGQAARDFTFDPGGGYLHPNFQNRATSYLLSHGPVNGDMRANDLFLADRNITVTQVGQCSVYGTVNSAPLPAPGSLGWATNLHNGAGNILRHGGAVEQVTSAGLREAVAPTSTDSGSSHFLLPRPTFAQ
jgi:hypothetical protein